MHREEILKVVSVAMESFEDQNSVVTLVTFNHVKLIFAAGKNQLSVDCS